MVVEGRSFESCVSSLPVAVDLVKVYSGKARIPVLLGRISS